MDTGRRQSGSTLVEGRLQDRLRWGVPARAWIGPALLSILVLGSGCATVGHDFPVAYVSSIEKGVTTQAQIKDRFGDPWRVGVEDGQTTWTYGKYKYRLFGQPSTKDLVVRFDARGVVSSYSFSTTEYESETAR